MSFIFIFLIGLIISHNIYNSYFNSTIVKESSKLNQSINLIFNKIEHQSQPLIDSINACSPNIQSTMLNLTYKEALISAVAYIKDGEIICSDRGDNWDNAKLNHLTPYFENTSQQSILFREQNPLVNNDTIFYGRRTNEGWVNFILDADYIEFWLINHLQPDIYHTRIENSHQQIIAEYPENSSQYKQRYQYTRKSDIYPISFQLSYTDEIWNKSINQFLPFSVFINFLISITACLSYYRIKKWRDCLETDITRGIKNSEFIGYYQPIINMNSNEIIGAEILMRWQHPKNGIMSPNYFIPHAESSSQIIKMTLQLLKQVTRDIDKICIIKPNFYISMNITYSMLLDESFVQGVITSVQDHPALHGHLVFELTERQDFTKLNRGRLIENMDLLRRHSIKWALDDFGTGYAGLNTLQDLHFEIIKIDKTFVASSITDSVTQSILSKIVEIGADLNCELVAEGVESERELTNLTKFSIQSAQGYYFAKPMHFKAFYPQLATDKPFRS